MLVKTNCIYNGSDSVNRDMESTKSKTAQDLTKVNQMTRACIAVIRPWSPVPNQHEDAGQPTVLHISVSDQHCIHADPLATRIKSIKQDKACILMHLYQWA